eukprot:4764082-Prymnesium_polylepis.2
MLGCGSSACGGAPGSGSGSGLGTRQRAGGRSAGGEYDSPGVRSRVRTPARPAPPALSPPSRPHHPTRSTRSPPSLLHLRLEVKLRREKLHDGERLHLELLAGERVGRGRARVDLGRLREPEQRVHDVRVDDAPPVLGRRRERSHDRHRRVDESPREAGGEELLDHLLGCHHEARLAQPRARQLRLAQVGRARRRLDADLLLVRRRREQRDERVRDFLLGELGADALRELVAARQLAQRRHAQHERRRVGLRADHLDERLGALQLDDRLAPLRRRRARREQRGGAPPLR